VKNTDRIAVRPFVPCFFDDFVPQRTKFMLQFTMSVVYVKLGKSWQNAPIIEMRAKVTANHRDQDEK
jgi:hypothetical protein